MTKESGDHFLTRWTRRKAEVAKAETEQASESRDSADADSGTAAAEGEPFDLNSLPSLDDLTAETDIRPFMNALVPENLRNAALRRVWELDTAIRDYVSPATEYAWNFNVEGGAPGYGPLEAGYDAAKMAVSMLSPLITDKTLVGDAGAQSPPRHLAGASHEMVAADSARNPSALAAPLAESGTVRNSTKIDTDSTIVPDNAGISVKELPEAQQDSVEVESGHATAALRHGFARHGGATPR